MENNRYYDRREEIVKTGEEMKEEYGIEFTVADIISTMDFTPDIDEYRDFCIWVRTNGGIK